MFHNCVLSFIFSRMDSFAVKSCSSRLVIGGMLCNHGSGDLVNPSATLFSYWRLISYCYIVTSKSMCIMTRIQSCIGIIYAGRSAAGFVTLHGHICLCSFLIRQRNNVVDQSSIPCPYLRGGTHWRNHKRLGAGYHLCSGVLLL